MSEHASLKPVFITAASCAIVFVGALITHHQPQARTVTETVPTPHSLKIQATQLASPAALKPFQVTFDEGTANTQLPFKCATKNGEAGVHESNGGLRLYMNYPGPQTVSPYRETFNETSPSTAVSMAKSFCAGRFNASYLTAFVRPDFYNCLGRSGIAEVTLDFKTNTATLKRTNAQIVTGTDSDALRRQATAFCLKNNT